LYDGYRPCTYLWSVVHSADIKITVNVYSKSVSVDDFRGILISLVVSKVFEHGILDRYGGFLLSSGPPLRLGVGDESITASDHVRLLGVTISSDLSPVKHV